MTYPSAITVDDFQARFSPRFDDEDSDFLGFILAEVITRVDDGWLEQDYRTAQLYLMAHMVTVEGANAGSGAVGLDTGVIASESFGPMSRSYVTGSNPGGSGWEASLNLTEYGRRFLDLRKGNFPGILVA